MKIGRILFSVVIIVSAYFIFWPLSVTPVAWQAPKDLGFVKEFSENTDLRPLEYIEIDGDNGPEDLAIDKNGSIAVSLHSGAIVKIDESGSALLPWVNTGGRPLGIEFDAMGNLIVADAYLGLLSVSPKGEIATISDTAQNIPILYADDLDISDDGKIVVLLNHDKLWKLTGYKGEDFFNGNIEEIMFDHNSQKEGINFIGPYNVLITDEKTKHEGGNLYSFSLD